MTITTIEQKLAFIWKAAKAILMIHIHIIEHTYSIVKNIIVAIIAGFSKKNVVAVDTTTSTNTVTK
jgi:hypothetical protein